MTAGRGSVFRQDFAMIEGMTTQQPGKGEVMSCDYLAKLARIREGEPDPPVKVSTDEQIDEILAKSTVVRKPGHYDNVEIIVTTPTGYWLREIAVSEEVALERIRDRLRTLETYMACERAARKEREAEIESKAALTYSKQLDEAADRAEDLRRLNRELAGRNKYLESNFADQHNTIERLTRDLDVYRSIVANQFNQPKRGES